MKSLRAFVKHCASAGGQVIMSLAIMNFVAGTSIAAQADANRPVFKITGKIDGLGGVQMRGLPGNVVTDENGFYSASVASGWSGSVTPVKAGYTFSPANIFCANTAEDRVQDFQAERIALKISGSLGLEGVVMRGLPGANVTDADGQYVAEIPFGWAGKVMPFKTGYAFSPASRQYSAVTSNVTNQDYAASVITYVISGKTGLEGVQMQGLPGNPVTRSDGSYSAVVQYGWSGKVVPLKEGYDFVPPFKTYSQIEDNHTEQNYVAKEINPGPPVTFTFVNEDLRVVLDAAASAAGINIMYAPIIQGVVTCTVDKVPLSKALEIILAATPYSAEKKDGYYLITTKKYSISGIILSDAGKPIKGLAITSDAGSSITDSQGRYSLSVDYRWKGTIMPESQGYTFNPKVRQYSAVTRDQTNQNYTARITMLTISDVIKFKDTPIPGVSVSANPGNIQTVTDSRGQFSMQVPYGWSGEITLSKPGYMIEPPAKSYGNTTTDIINGIPVPPASPMEPAIKPPIVLQTQSARPEGRRILIVPDKSVKSEDIARIGEDVNIMAEIFDERFREPQLIGGVLRDFGDFFGRDNEQTEAVYIQGYGVIFIMNLNYQFSSTSQGQAESESQTNNDIDQTWERARERVLAPTTGGRQTQTSPGQYEEQMVDILKAELIRTLKYAANIRGLQQEDWVVLSVAGKQETAQSISGRWTAYSENDKVTWTYGPAGKTPSSAGTIMTMRVKKSQVDAFAAGELTFEQFREKVQILLN